MAVHILKNKANEFYWTTVKKGFGGKFEYISRSTETYTEKHNCKKSIHSEASLLSSVSAYIVVDHTLIGKTKVYSRVGVIKTPLVIISSELQREINFVISEHEFQNGRF